MKHVVIVGASLAGVSAAEELCAERGFDGDITLIDAEASPALRPAAALEGRAVEG